MFCHKCATANKTSSKVCGTCGAALAKEYIRDAALNDSGDLQVYYEATIGRKNTDYYVTKFSLFDSLGVGASWNWPSLFLNFYWLIYRKMWGWAILYSIVSLAFFSLIKFAPILGSLFHLSAIIVFSMYANVLYYRRVHKRIARAKRICGNQERTLGFLLRDGGTTRMGWFVAVLTIIALGLLASIAIPAYDQLQGRMKVGVALRSGYELTKVVSEYYRQHGAIPKSLADTGSDSSLPKSVKEIHFDNKGGVITVVMNIPALEGKELLLVPSIEANKELIWECVNLDVPDRYLPSACRTK